MKLNHIESKAGILKMQKESRYAMIISLIIGTAFGFGSYFDLKYLSLSIAFFTFSIFFIIDFRYWDLKEKLMRYR